MIVRLLLVRPLPDTVGETRRVCHAVFLHAEGAIPERLRANCGAEFARSDVELLAEPAGMPCVGCLRRVPQPDDVGTAELSSG